MLNSLEVPDNLLQIFLKSESGLSAFSDPSVEVGESSYLAANSSIRDYVRASNLELSNQRPNSPVTMNEQQLSSSDDEDFIQLTAWEKIKFLLSNSDYVLLMTSLTGIYYLISGLTFWTKFYLIHTLTV